MTIKSTGRAPVSVPVSTAKPAAAARPAAAPARPAADGFGTSSSFGSASSAASGSAARSLGNPDAPVRSTSSAATGGGDSVTPARNAAVDVLKDVEGGKDALEKCFKTDLATQKDITAAITQFDELRQAGALSPEQEAAINKALAMQVGLRGAADMSKSFLDKCMEELNKKRD